MVDSNFRTSDLGLASYLRYLGFTPVFVDISRGKVFIEFEPSPKILELARSFANESLVVELDLCRYLSLFKSTKGMVMRARGE
jgi:hypothetical protein